MDGLETEYQVINTWRNSKTQQHDTVSSILLPLVAFVFFSSFTGKAGFNSLPIVAYYFTNIVVIVWRVWGRCHNLAIIKRYPRIVELEVQLRYRFTREYLGEKWRLNDLANRENVINKIQEYCRLCRCQKITIFDYFFRRFRDVGHLCWDILALLFIIITSVAIGLKYECWWGILIPAFIIAIAIILIEVKLFIQTRRR